MKKLLIASVLFVTLTIQAQIVILGDGLSAYWPDKFPVETISFAHGGNTTLEAVLTYHLTAHQVPGTHCAVYLGINDIADGCEVEDIYFNLKRLWGALRFDGYFVEAFTLACPENGNKLKVAQLNKLILSDTSLYDGICRPDLMFRQPQYWEGVVCPSELANILIAKWLTIDFLEQ